MVAPPKGGELRDVPLPGPVADALRAHIKQALPTVGVIPERKPGGSYAESRENGMHALRHFYASVLLDAGETIRALAEYLGHSDPGLTLRVYAHLMPSSRRRTRKAVAAVFEGARGCLRTGPSPLSLRSRPSAPERSGDRSRSPESARPHRPDGPGDGPGQEKSPLPAEKTQAGGLFVGDYYFLPWFFTASMAAFAASGSR